MEIYLASKSPRRKELLERMGLEFTVRAVNTNETMDPFLHPSDEVARVSLEKAKAVQPHCMPDDIIISADTIVVCDSLVMGKPHSESEAFSMLRRLSGRDHQVMTGLTVIGDGRTENLTVTAIYEKNVEPEKPWLNPFKDVKTSDWFYEGVKFANQQELFNGTAHDTFSPNDAMTRAMLVTVLWRLDGKTTPTKTSGFVDVPSKAYYTEAVAWAAENGIVNGTDATHFAPNDEVTREQIAAILFRYAEKKGVDTTKRADLNAFPDANKVSAYAKDALAWANAEGLVRGSNENGKDYLAPAASATRAQVATILARYAQNIVK